MSDTVHVFASPCYGAWHGNHGQTQQGETS